MHRCHSNCRTSIGTKRQDVVTTGKLILHYIVHIIQTKTINVLQILNASNANLNKIKPYSKTSVMTFPPKPILNWKSVKKSMRVFIVSLDDIIRKMSLLISKYNKFGRWNKIFIFKSFTLFLYYLISYQWCSKNSQY